MNKIFGAFWGLVISVLGSIVPGMKPPVHTEPPVAVTNEITPTIEATPSATPTILVTKIPLPTRFMTSTPVPTPTINPARNAACNSIGLPTKLFAGVSCLPNENITPAQLEDCSRSDTDGIRRCDNKRYDWENTVAQQKEGNIRSRMLAECNKVEKEVFVQCTDSINANATRLTEEVSKDFEKDLNSCFNSSQGKELYKDATSILLKRYKLNAKLEAMYEYCFSHGNTVNDLHF